MNNNLISIGKIINFHGIKGEVKIGFTSGNDSVFQNVKQLYIFLNDKKIGLDIESVRFHKNFALVKFKQINSINEVMSIKGLLVHVVESDFKSNLDADEYLIKDLIGLHVYDSDGVLIGIVNDMGDNNASDLIEVKKTNGLKFLVPFVKEWVPVVDLINKKIVIKSDKGIDDSLQKDEEA